jgi:hypothetical protein
MEEAPVFYTGPARVRIPPRARPRSSADERRDPTSEDAGSIPVGVSIGTSTGRGPARPAKPSVPAGMRVGISALRHPCGLGSLADYRPSKAARRVRFSQPAPISLPSSSGQEGGPSFRQHRFESGREHQCQFLALQFQWFIAKFGNRGKSRGSGMIIRFPRRRESDSVWACRRLRILTV